MYYLGSTALRQNSSFEIRWHSLSEQLVTTINRGRKRPLLGLDGLMIQSEQMIGSTGTVTPDMP